MRKIVKIALLVLVLSFLSLSATNETLATAPEPGFGPQILTVVKHVINDGGGTATAGQFLVRVTGASASPSVFHPSESGTDVTLDAFSDYTVTEDAFANYTPSYSPDCSGTSVNEFHAKTCTITNTYVPPPLHNPTLTLLKTVINNNGGAAVDTAWTLSAHGPTPSVSLVISGVEGDASITNAVLTPGTYVLSETGPSGYLAVGTAGLEFSCVINAGSPVSGNLVVLNLGDNVVCTVTNDDILQEGGDPETGHIVVNKITNPSEDSTMFHFQTGGTGYSVFDLADQTTPNDQTLEAGTYSVSENSVSGWTLSNVSCSSDDEFSVSDPSNITLHANETITCTFTNTKETPPPSITSNDNGGGGGSSGSRRRGGSVLGASTPPVGEVLGASTDVCSAVDIYMRKGYKNDAEQVKTLQNFLNDYMKSGLTVDGKYGALTENAVKAFQLARKDKVLTPWGLTLPTGIFYKTSLAEVKRLMCPVEFGNLPIPTDLIPWGSNFQQVP